MKHIDEHLAHKLEQRKQEDNLRQLTTVQAPIDFYSNDYLGLAANGLRGESIPASSEGSRWRGSTGSRLLSGNSAAAEILEAQIAAFHQADAALLFNSGYDANIGLLSCIASRDSVIISDELCHASLIDGIRLSQCRGKYKFRHNDLHSLEDKLKRYAINPVIVVVESVYSMDGDMAPLQELVSLCERYGVSLVADEAHATGVFGAHGEGLVQAYGLQSRVFARIHTFGKALGCHGAVIIGSDLLKQYLINFARPFIYTTALPGHAIHSIGKAYEYLASGAFTNKSLHELIAYFRMQIKKRGGEGWMDSESPIQALVTADSNKARQLASNLQQAGIQVKPILHPTVPAGRERLRICLHTFNTKQQIDLLFDTLYP